MNPVSAMAARDRLAGPSIAVLSGDLDSHALEIATREQAIAWDIETTGLEWRTERIATVQVYAGSHAFVVRLGRKTPVRLKRVLEDPAIRKVMHHAMFDLRFMAYAWNASPRGVACTKIAAKLALPGADPADYSLASLVRRFFHVELDKEQRISDWTARKLDSAQLSYAVDDVRYLLPLYERLERRLRLQSLVELRDRCYDHLSARVDLELKGYPDVFEY
jgi:ribonuclease D